MRVRWMAGGLVVLGVAFGAGYSLRGEPKPKPVAVLGEPSSGAAVEDLAAKVQRLEMEAMRMRLQLASLEGGAGRSEAAASAPTSQPVVAVASVDTGGPSAESADKLREEARMRFAHYERALQREARDSVWASRMEGQLLDLGTELQKKHLPGTHVKHVECRATLCAVQLEHTDARERERVAMLLHVPDLPRVSLLKEAPAEGQPARTIAYLAKQRMPAPPPE